MADLKHISGFKDLEKLLRDLPGPTEAKVLQLAVNAGAREWKKEVKASAPVDAGGRSISSKTYGRLSDNIKVQKLKRTKTKGIRGARVFTGKSFWGMFLEFGTRFITARPWFRPAISRSEDMAVKKLAQSLGRGIEREAKKLAKLKTAVSAK